ncbi:DegT/DnrJ/EryC1/StrS family aminotransferase [bacterium]|nr:DegT/DnrJ/EryC1/StrS family aminotransferase [bacterium]
MKSGEKSFLVFGSPALGKSEIDEVHQCLESGWIGTGPRVAQFEEEFRKYKGVPHAVALNSCTAALHLSLLAAGISEGDEVITTPMTFCATVNSIIHAGGKPVLVDVEPDTFNIDVEAIERRITPKTKAILPVHFAGRPCKMDRLMEIASRHGLMVIEDCAHAIEAEYHGKKIGTFGDFGCFSFYVTKNVTTGEGGMLLARKEEHSVRAKRLGLHGMSQDAWKRFGDTGYKHYEVVEAGFKYNMMDMQAAIGIHQLRKVNEFRKRREEIWNAYTEAFAGLPITLPAAIEPNTVHSYHLYTLLIDEARCGVKRDEFLERMTREKIGVGVHYVSMTDHKFYQDKFGWKTEDYPHSTRIGRQTVSIPISPKLTDEDVLRIIQSVKRSLE